MIRYAAPKRAEQRHKSCHDSDEPPLQAARRADANQLPHEQAEIEASRVD
jgi:hypothetical protein